MKKVHSEDAAVYRVDTTVAHEDRIIAQALLILNNRLRERDTYLSSPNAVRDYLRLQLATLEYEVFGCLFIDAQNRLIANDCMFRGTVTQTSVYPREVVREAMRHNAVAVIVYHNHPSGVAAASRADEAITRNLKDTLALVDVKLIDHFIVAGTEFNSLAEKGVI